MNLAIMRGVSHEGCRAFLLSTQTWLAWDWGINCLKKLCMLWHAAGPCTNPAPSVACYIAVLLFIVQSILQSSVVLSLLDNVIAAYVLATTVEVVEKITYLCHRTHTIGAIASQQGVCNMQRGFAQMVWQLYAYYARTVLDNLLVSYLQTAVHKICCAEKISVRCCRHTCIYLLPV